MTDKTITPREITFRVRRYDPTMERRVRARTRATT